jgi:uncharacterized SAM-binding protein YcdF (DUF218 family)
MFVLKKFISGVLLPLPAALLLMAVGLGLLWFTQRQRAGKVLVTIAFVLLAVFSLAPVGNALLAPLEAGQAPLFPAERLAAATIKAGRNPKWIVVLGGGHAADPSLPAIDQLGASALLRLGEGIRLHRQLPGTKLVLSGGIDGPTKHADVLAEAARGLGVPAEDLVLERTTTDTEDEADKLTRIVGKDDFVLVTGAFHMRRSLALFRARGVDPIAAPTDHSVRGDGTGFHLDALVPRAGALLRTQVAEHEYLGRLWSRLRGKL